MFKMTHKDSGQIVQTYGFAPFFVSADAYTAQFLVWTNDGWDFRPVSEFVPLNPIWLLELEESE